MSAKTAQNSVGLIVHLIHTCGNIRTVWAQDEPWTDPQYSTLAARFWAQVDRKSPTECWPWTAHCHSGGYGEIKIAGRNYSAHRIAWQLASGRPIPSGLLIRHDCDNRLCCNPSHLVVGTQLQNVHDAIARGRHVNPNWRQRWTVRNQHGRKDVA